MQSSRKEYDEQAGNRAGPMQRCVSLARFFARAGICAAIALTVMRVSVAAAEPDETCHASTVACVETTVRGIIAADNAGDLDAVLSFYDDNAVLIAPTGPDVVGKAAIRDHYVGLFAENSLSIDIDIQDSVVSGEWAISRGVNFVAATSKSTGETAHAESKFLMTLRRDADAGWRIVHLMWVNRPAQAE